MTPEQLSALPRCTHKHIGLELTPKVETPPESAERVQEIYEAMDSYLEQFTYVEGDKCPGCDRELGGMFGSFKFAIVSGEGTCAKCGWPCRAQHIPKHPDGTKIFTRMLEIVLPYHPSLVTRNEKASEPESA